MKTSPKKILSKLPLAIACTLAIAAATTGCQKHGSTHHKPHPQPQPQPQAQLDITVQHTSADNLQHTLQDKALGDPSANEIITVQDQTDTSLSTKITGDANSMADEIFYVSKDSGLEINTTHLYKISGQDYTNSRDQQCTAQPVSSQHGSDANQLQATLKYTCKDTQPTNTSGIALTITHQVSSANFRSTHNNSLNASNTKEKLDIQDKELKLQKIVKRV